jgi:hypothetical protein
MITSDDAHRIATEAIGPATAADGQGWQFEQFDARSFARADWMSQESRHRASPRTLTPS